MGLFRKVRGCLLYTSFFKKLSSSVIVPTTLCMALCSIPSYLLGDFRLRTGEDVRTKFEIMEGMLQSACLLYTS